MKLTFVLIQVLLISVNVSFHSINKQLLDEVKHDIMNYQNRGLCYQTRGFDNS